MDDAEIAGGIVGSTLSLLLVKLDAFATSSERKLEENIREAVPNLERELQSMEVLLRDGCSKKERDHQFSAWFKVVVSIIDSDDPETYRSRCIGHVSADTQNKMSKIFKNY